MVGFLHSFSKWANMDRSYRILLCDDDPDEALFLETAFLNAGFQVRLEWFDRCSALLGHLSQLTKAPDLIFVDLNMPGEGGFECLARLRSFAVYKHLPVIIYSTSALSKDIERAFETGASMYLSKTDCEIELIEMVRYIVTVDRQQLQFPRKECFCYFPKVRMR